MFCPPPPQSNVESVEREITIYKKIVKSNDLLTSTEGARPTSLELNTFHYFDLYREAAISKFIGEYKLTLFLEEARNHIKKYFPHSVISKELYTDPEEEIQKLYLTVLTSSMSRKEVLKNNRKLFSNWDLAKNKKFNDYVNITARAI